MNESKRAVIYTPDNIAYVKLHYNIDMLAADIAKEIGTTARNLRSNVDRLKGAGHKFTSRSKPIGTVTTWNGRPYVKGENGFKPIPTKRVFKVGEYRTHTKSNGSVDTYLKTETGWVYVAKPKREKEPVEKRPVGRPKQAKRFAAHKQQKDRLPANTLVGRSIVQNSKPEAANRVAILKGRNPTAKTRSRPHATNDHNPAVVKVRNTDERKAELIEAGWRTVKVGEAPATYKFLPPEKLAMYL